MELFIVPGNIFKLDVGTMLGNAPKVLWERGMPADEKNRIRMAIRPLLAITQNATILFEGGIGAFLEPRFRERYGVDEPERMVLKALDGKGVSHKQVTHIFLTHPHYYHAGGFQSAWQENHEPALLFPNARYFVSEAAWERANHPLSRDRASFIPELDHKLEMSGRLNLTRPEDTFFL